MGPKSQKLKSRHSCYADFRGTERDREQLITNADSYHLRIDRGLGLLDHVIFLRSSY